MKTLKALSKTTYYCTWNGVRQPAAVNRESILDYITGSLSAMNAKQSQFKVYCTYGELHLDSFLKGSDKLIQRAKIAVQSTNYRGATGTFLFITDKGQRVNISPIFQVCGKLYEWNKENGYFQEEKSLLSDYIKIYNLPNKDLC